MLQYMIDGRPISKFSNHFYKYVKYGEHLKINFIPMGFNGKKIIFMKVGRAAGTFIWKNILEKSVFKLPQQSAHHFRNPKGNSNWSI